ncbi:hypothetical protein [Mucilaginibacter flavidus]|uniref:hypothetical protein n=1 Tax=Mucilaginibacter flavidus TaxID=2949309 RepID=UPI002093F5C5|nr:hypothetical protein [Mucilaginibacter flavidus]MCO5945706.1 hypothetical protein [Mucilaginibacter flavidus]
MSSDYINRIMSGQENIHNINTAAIENASKQMDDALHAKELQRLKERQSDRMFQIVLVLLGALAGATITLLIEHFVKGN